ncbi:hypothetical protein I204_02993 [Kwoniella mangroviensis CBS 8886]|nr:uncharacterized protein I203_00053 [Kwoniella mangroviensis CBS 8507]OCF69926.1 hypothetical protein I203_00053 [Kwoniella mangroviensis CBS 8507]OCF75701.1 hypothetical protein I204_02993 [Kwoniella mangroviensis CBS 8886]
MAPSGLVISKLGIQATASDEVVKGLMCLKISLPKDAEGRPGARWALFSSTPPKLLSTPTIYPLPLPLPASRAPQLRKASRLLALPQPSTYPPSSPSGLGGKPYIDVSSTTGKVYVVVDPVSSRRGSMNHRASGSSSAQSTSTGRKEWLICMDFEIALEKGVEEDISKVLLPIPRCLDNTIRFQILSHTNASSSSLTNQEVDIFTDPKMLPLPTNAFPSPVSQSKARVTGRKVKGKGKIKATVGEEGWEDGEVLGPDDVPTESDEDTEVSDVDDDDSEEDGGSWLEGRFPSTEILRLEWSFNSPALSDIPSLQVSPMWNRQQSSISIAYLAHIPNQDNPVQLDIDVPNGWSWSELSIQGESLSNWRCLDGEWGSQSSDPDDTMEQGEEFEDSFATVKAKRAHPPLTPSSSTHSTISNFLPTTRSTSSSSASLMRQTFPSLNGSDRIEDFSFELSSIEQQNQKPLTPKSLRKSPLQMLVNSTSSSTQSKWDEPRFGRLFNLYFKEEESNDKTITIQGTLIPLDKMLLVSSALPVKIPLITIDNAESNQCQVECPSAIYGTATQSTSDIELVDVSLGGRLFWTGSDGGILEVNNNGMINGDVRVRIRRSPWGIIMASMRFPFPPKSDEAGFSLKHADHIRLIRTSVEGVEVPRAMYEDGGISKIRIAQRDKRSAGGTVEVEWEMVMGLNGEIGLPCFDSAEGEMKLELVGEEWIPYLKSTTTNMKTLSSTLYTLPLSSPYPPTLSISSYSSMTSRRKTLLSFSTLMNLFLLWLLLSMGQQLQRIKNEVDFVRDEYRDLGLYVYGSGDTVKSRDHGSLVTTTTTTIASTSIILNTASALPSSNTGTPGKILKEDKKQDNNVDVVVVDHSASHSLSRVVARSLKGWENVFGHPT